MGRAEQLITENLDLWHSAVKVRSSAGRGSSKKLELYGISKLRELILDLAVRGMLIQQDPEDEPSQVLLVRIANERSRLIKEKKIKNSKCSLTNDTWSKIRIPTIWQLTTLGSVADWGSGSTPKRENQNHYGGSLTWLKSGELNDCQALRGSSEKITEEAVKAGSFRSNKIGDVLIAMYGATIGKVAILDETAYTNQAVCGCTPFNGVFNRYLFFYLISQRKNFHAASEGGAQPNISKVKLLGYPLPLPPLAEQHRIVAKVDELMALCAQLEAEQENNLETHETLVSTLLDALTSAASDASQFADAWQRIKENFDILFTTESSVDQLKRTILQLAVMGKLVPQNPEDEPALELLNKIATKKEMLITTKKIKRTRNKFTAKENQLEYSLPPQWAKASLADLGDFSGGKTPSKNNSEYWGGEIPWVTPKDMKTSRIKNSEDHVSQLALEDGLNINLPGSILFVVRSGILRRRLPIAINDVSCTVNQDLKVLRPFEEKTTQYLMLMCRGFEEIILKELTKTGTTVESIIFEKFSTYKFPLPPLAEQQRIVTKVDELMALCDHLKASLHSAQDTQLKLADSIVEQAIQSPA